MNLLAMLQEYEDALRFVKRRLHFLVQFQRELDQATRGKPYSINNDIVYTAMLDTRDLAIIDLASWCKRHLASGGLFGAMKGRLNELNAKPVSRATDPYLRSEARRHRMEARERLFPGAPTRIAPVDVDGLAQRFAQLTARVIEDRNANRAHRYERVGSSAVPMLDFDEQASVFARIESMLNDVRTLITGTTTSYDDSNFAPSDVTARDVVDLLLFGNSYRLATARAAGPMDEAWWRGRDRFYAWLHDRHDDRGGGGFFNDAAFFTS